MFSRSNNVIVGGAFYDIHGQDSSNLNGFERLLQAASPSAFHNSGDRIDPPKCHPKTRLKVLEKITNWIDGTEHQNESVMWVNGGAGVGKSAIAQTMAERLAEEKRLVASFFFSRTDPSRNNAKHLIPTIAYHTIRHIPDLEKPITQMIAMDPLVFQLSVDAQFSALLTEPMRALTEIGFFQSVTAPRVIIIDGLDECNDPSAQVSILNAISKALRNHLFPLLFLIASRPEQHLSMAFTSKSFKGFLTSLTLDDSFFPKHDIRFFLEDQFEELRDSHPLRAYLPPSWPDPTHIKTLVEKSSGQFIYASTVIKYISSHRHRPSHRLDVILGLRPARNETPFSELDALYTYIFSSVDVESIGCVLDILAFHFVFQTFPPWAVDKIEAFLSLEAGDIQIALGDLASIASIEGGPEPQIRVLHASLFDFLLDQARSNVFYIDLQLKRGVFAERYLEIMMIGVVSSLRIFAPCSRMCSWDIDHRLPGQCYWSFELPSLVKNATLTPALRRKISEFSLLTVSTYCYEYDGERDRKQSDFFHFIYRSIGSVELKAPAYDPFSKMIDEYLVVQIGSYYSHTPHIFLLALIGIRTPYNHFSCKRSPRYRCGNYCDIQHLFGISDLDNLNLFFIENLCDTHEPPRYWKYVRTLLNDPSRSGVMALNEERYAIAALHCVKILCDNKALGPSRNKTLRDRYLRSDGCCCFGVEMQIV